ncbi:hypothetical protein RYT77_004651 [Salmonella enterica]|nr:hypothetical protein [Salmonella enterica]
MNNGDFDLIDYVYQNIYPYGFKLWLVIFGFCFVFCMTGKIKHSDDLSLLDIIAITLKKWGLVYFFTLTLLISCLFSLYAMFIFRFDFETTIKYLKMVFSQIRIDYMIIPDLIFVLMLPYLIFFVHKRYVKPRISAFIRRFRVSQTSDAISDVRVEHGKYEPKIFNPTEYYKNNNWFIGLNENENPIYISDEEFTTTNARILGATQTGKGVLQGVIIDQAIRKKDKAVCFIDQKPDKFIYSIMNKACLDEGRKLITFDICTNRGITYEPFLHGDKIDKLARIYNTLDINDTGTTADHYLESARACILKVYDMWDGTLAHLKNLLSGGCTSFSEEDYEFILKFGRKIVVKLEELSGLNGVKSSDNLLNIRQIIENGDILYIRGKLNSDLVKRVVKCIIQEMTDAFIATPDKKKHYTCVIDEARFVISPEIADAMATIVSSHANMILAYQESDDLLNIKGYSSTIAASIKSSIETNSNIVIVQKCNYKTAELLAQESGTIPLTITKLEHVNTDDFGAESWGGKRLIGQQEDYLIPINTILTLPARVGVLKTVSSLSKIVFSCWVSVDKFTPLPAEIKESSEKKKAPVSQSDNNTSVKLSDTYIPSEDDKKLAERITGNQANRSAITNTPVKTGNKVAEEDNLRDNVLDIFREDK